MIEHELLAELSVITDEEKKILDGDRNVEKSLYSDHSDFTIDSAKFLREGRLIEIRPNTRFVHFPPHKHNYVEMTYMCSGETTHIVNGKEIVLREGELLIMDQESVQEILPAGKDDIAVNFIILPEFFEYTLSTIGTALGSNTVKDFLTGCFGRGNTTFDFLYFKTADDLIVRNLIENLIYLLIHGHDQGNEMSRITMSLVFMELMGKPGMIELGANPYEQGLLIRVLQYIDRQYKDAELTCLANSLGVEITYLSRLIKKMTGETFTELIQNKRLEHVCLLLRTTSLSVADVATASGYENKSYFHRIFMKKFGMSPAKWRKSTVAPLPGSITAPQAE